MSTIASPRAAVLAPLRDWLRTTATGALCGLDTNLNPDARAVYAGGLPVDAPARAITISKVGLTPDGTVTERTLVQFDCWAEKGAAGDCEELAAALKTDLEQATPGTQLGSSTVRLLGASIEAEVALPDPGDGAPRYVVTALVTTKVVA